jgi:hypothetical protein
MCYHTCRPLRLKQKAKNKKTIENWLHVSGEWRAVQGVEHILWKGWRKVRRKKLRGLGNLAK